MENGSIKYRVSLTKYSAEIDNEPMLQNYVHDSHFFVQCAEEFEAMCSNTKKFREEIASHQCLLMK
jgi:hypothetical protein